MKKIADHSEDPADIRETDIVFDCPHCGKSLAIDYRGAGLSIPCSDCGRSVVVPIPEGMELTDIDSSEEEQEIRILNLRRSLAAAERKIQELERKVRDLNAKGEILEKARANSMYRFGMVLEKAGVIRRAIQEISDILKDIPKTGQ